jgi:hypothetical protein
VENDDPQKSGQSVQTDALDAVDKKMLALEIERPGIKSSDIAAQVGLQRDTVTRRRKAPLYQRALHEALKSPLDIIRDGQAKAARKLIKLLDATTYTVDGHVVDDVKTQLSAAATILRPVLPHAVAHGTSDDFEATLSGMSDAALQRFLTEGAAVINESDIEIIDAEVIEEPDAED